ncbi:hypothetical protein V6N11_070279 [Hibiscus sabdariffa]|uniref:Uncharacterized protein n=1 Tax=Hibiscus sabdariffa TaxID=183260 RepID=A0ABR2QEJ4_9ROSI
MAFCKKVKEKGKGLCSALLGLSDKSFLIFPTKTVVAKQQTPGLVLSTNLSCSSRSTRRSDASLRRHTSERSTLSPHRCG